MLIKFILMGAWVLYCLSEGMRDGYFYHYKNTSIQTRSENTHWLFFSCRCVVLSLIMLCIYPNPWEYNLPSDEFTLGLALLFSFFHNGMYYITRRKLSKGNLYPKGWKDSSTASTSWMEFKYDTRLGMAVAGAALLAESFIANYFNLSYTSIFKFYLC